MIRRNIPWASVYGNHDSQFNISREALFQEETKHRLSYTKHSPLGIPGVTNYYVPILPHGELRNEDPVAILWFLDSQGGAPFQGHRDPDSIPNWVEDTTVDWFTSEQRLIQQRWGDIPSLVFVHIPPTAFLTAQREMLSHVEDTSAHFPGLNADIPLASQGDGWQDVPLMQALVDTPGLHSIYSGHDHGDAWCANWPVGRNSTKGLNKPHVCFCKHTGYGGYGRWNRGSRTVKLSFEQEDNKAIKVETWIRMENGKVIQKVGLNATYGVDIYPTDDGE